MRFVLDASIAVKWVLPEPDSPDAVRLREAFVRGDHELLAPTVFPVEIAHALTRCERRGLIGAGSAARLLNNVLSTSPRLYEITSCLSRAVELSSSLRIGVYDCLYMALSEEQHCDVVTADLRLAQLCPNSVLLKDIV